MGGAGFLPATTTALSLTILASLSAFPLVVRFLPGLLVRNTGFLVPAALLRPGLLLGPARGLRRCVGTEVLVPGLGVVARRAAIFVWYSGIRRLTLFLSAAVMYFPGIRVGSFR